MNQNQPNIAFIAKQMFICKKVSQFSGVSLSLKKSFDVYKIIYYLK